MNGPQPSLLVFTLSPAGECARRRLLPARIAHQQIALHRRTLEAALLAGRTAGCRLEVSSPGPVTLAPDVRRVGQRGRSFGERFGNSARSAWGRSRGPLVVVGSDVPGLRDRHVRQALERLGDDPGRVVVGPSPDGGFYLLAANRPLDNELARVRWCTRRALDSLLAALRDGGREVVLLEPLGDLDDARDLHRWLASSAATSVAWRRLAHRLRDLLAQHRRPLRLRSLGSVAPGVVTAFAGRAPPA